MLFLLLRQGNAVERCGWLLFRPTDYHSQSSIVKRLVSPCWEFGLFTTGNWQLPAWKKVSHAIYAVGLGDNKWVNSLQALSSPKTDATRRCSRHTAATADRVRCGVDGLIGKVTHYGFTWEHSTQCLHNRPFAIVCHVTNLPIATPCWKASSSNIPWHPTLFKGDHIVNSHFVCFAHIWILEKQLSNSKSVIIIECSFGL